MPSIDVLPDILAMIVGFIFVPAYFVLRILRHHHTSKPEQAQHEIKKSVPASTNALVSKIHKIRWYLWLIKSYYNRINWVLSLLKHGNYTYALAVVQGREDWITEQEELKELQELNYYNEIDRTHVEPLYENDEHLYRPVSYAQIPNQGYQFSTSLLELKRQMGSLGVVIVLGARGSGKTTTLFSFAAYEIAEGNDVRIFSPHFTSFHPTDQRINFRLIPGQYKATRQVSKILLELEELVKLMRARLILYRCGLDVGQPIKIFIDELNALMRFAKLLKVDLASIILTLIYEARKANIDLYFGNQGGLSKSLGLDTDATANIEVALLRNVSDFVESKFLGDDTRLEQLKNIRVGLGEWKVYCKTFPELLTCKSPTPEEINKVVEQLKTRRERTFKTFSEQREEIRQFLTMEFVSRPGELAEGYGKSELVEIREEIAEEFGSISKETEIKPMVSLLGDDFADKYKPTAESVESWIRTNGLPKAYSLEKLSDQERQVLEICDEYEANEGTLISDENLSKATGIPPATCNRIKLKLAALELIPEPVSKRSK